MPSNVTVCPLVFRELSHEQWERIRRGEMTADDIIPAAVSIYRYHYQNNLRYDVYHAVSDLRAWMIRKKDPLAEMMTPEYMNELSFALGEANVV